MKNPRAFASYATRDPRDVRLVEALGARLRSLGVDLWHYESLDEAIPLDAALAPALVERVRASTVFVVILSEAALQSPWVAAEVAAARPGVESGQTFVCGLLRQELGDGGLAAGPESFRWLGARRLLKIGEESATVEEVAVSVAQRLSLPYVPGRNGRPDFPLAGRLSLEIDGITPRLPDHAAGVRTLLALLARQVEDARGVDPDGAVSHALALRATLVTLLPSFRPYYSEVALGVVLAEAGRWEESEAVFRELAANGGPAVDENLPAALAWHAVRRRELRRACALYREARAHFRSQHPDADDPHILANLLLCTVLAGGGVRAADFSPLLDPAPPTLAVREERETALLRVIRAAGLAETGRVGQAFAELSHGVSLLGAAGGALCDFLDVVEVVACRTGDRGTFDRAARFAEQVIVSSYGEAARGDWNRVLDDAGEHVAHRLARLWVGLGRYGDAVGVLYALARHDPERCQYRVELAVAHLGARRDHEAVALCTEVAGRPLAAWRDDRIGSPPEPGRAAWYRGFAAGLSGDWADAARWYREHVATRRLAGAAAAIEPWYAGELSRLLPHRRAVWVVAPPLPAP